MTPEERRRAEEAHVAGLAHDPVTYDVRSELPVGRGLFQGQPDPERNVVEFRGMAAADPTTAALRALTTPAKWGAAQRVTVDQMLDHPGRIARRLAEVERTHELGRALFPPGPPLTRQQQARRRATLRIRAFRTRLAKRIAPWVI